MASALSSLVSHTNLRSLLIFALFACFAFLSVEIGYNFRYTATDAHVAAHSAASLLLPRYQQQAAQPRPGESAEEVLGKLRAEIEKQQLRTAKRQLFRDEVRTLMDEIARLKANHSGPIKAEDLKTFADVSNNTRGGGGGGGELSGSVSDAAAAAELAKCEASLQECRESLGQAGGEAGMGGEAGTNSAAATTGDAATTGAVTGSGGAGPAVVVAMSESEMLAALQTQCEQQQILNERLQQERERLAAAVAHYSRNTTDCNDTVSSDDALQAARKAIEECGRAAEQARESAIGGGYSSGQLSATRIRATSCSATDEELLKYLNYSPKKPCPDDWYFVQHLIFVRNCLCLPRRRCFAAAPPDYQEPSIPFPQSVFDPRALLDANVRWDLHRCKSYGCINSRLLGDCRDCFNLTLEAKRWKNNYRGAVTLAEVMKLKPPGSIRIGLDAGGGTGSFAAALALYNVTILTTAMNTETVQEVEMGLPYMETIAQRGLVPLHVPHKARQPFFDNTLDLIHTVNSIKYFSIPEFEELLFEWDRILRPGGIWWFELFYAPVWEMPLYIGVIEQFGYGKKYWNLTPKTDTAEREAVRSVSSTQVEKLSRLTDMASICHVSHLPQTVSAQLSAYQSTTSYGSSHIPALLPTRRSSRALQKHAWLRLPGSHDKQGIHSKKRGVVPSVRAKASNGGDGAAPVAAGTAPDMVVPRSAEQAVNQGLELYKKGRVRDALRRFEMALEMKPSEEEAQAALYNKACCHAFREEGAQAQEALRDALRYGLQFSVILSDPDMAAFRAMPEFRALQEEARKGGEEVGGKFRRDLKLIAEVQAPFRGVRRFLYVALGMAAGIATVITIPRFILAVQGGVDAPDLLTTGGNLAIDLGGGAAMVGLYLWEQRREEEQMGRVSRDETLSRLPLRLQSGKVVELVQLRGTTRPVILSGRKEAVQQAMKRAEGYRKQLQERGVLLVPVLQSKGGGVLAESKKKGFAAVKKPAATLESLEEFEEKAREAAAKRVAEADRRLKAEVVSPGEWDQWVRSQQKAEKVAEGTDAFIVLRLDGRVRKSGTGMPDWADLINELPPLDSLVSKLER